MMTTNNGKSNAVASSTRNLLLSSSVYRLARIIGHIIPQRQQHFNHTGSNSLAPTTTSFKYLSHLFCIQFSGDLHGLTIENAHENMNRFIESNSMLQRCLLNTSNDVCAFASALHQMNPSLTCEIHGHICADQVLSKLSNFIQTSVRDCFANDKDDIINNNNNNNKGLIIYWSGHGRLNSIDNNLDLCMAQSLQDHKTEQLFDLNQMIKCSRHAGIQGPLLLVLECCHSGIAAQVYGNWDSTRLHQCVLVLASCRGEELSGAWVMDGIDTSGIMTKILIDPIGTYFKIAYHVFYDFGGSWLTLVHTDQNHERELYLMYDKYSDLIMDEWFEQGSDTAPNSHKLAMKWIREHAPHIYTLYKNYLLLVRYGDKLHMPQTAHSFPDLSQTKLSYHWGHFEEGMERMIVQLWETRSQQAVPMKEEAG